MRENIAEFIGTFFLVFVGTGAIIMNHMFDGVITNLGIGASFGLIVMAIIYAIGDVSGAHLNPAVSFGFWMSKQISCRKFCHYSISQVLGACAASGLYRLMFGTPALLGATTANGPILAVFIMEIILTTLLMFVILSVSTGSKEKGIMAGIAVGGIIGLEAIFAGPLTGASMNPARSLAPALFSLHWDALWIYLTAPFIGAFIAVPSCKLTRQDNCCIR